jgi:sugar lactone lactonase YvrE
MEPIVRQIFDDRCELAEGPVWLDGCLWWVDINGQAVHRLRGPTLEEHEHWPMPAKVGAALPTEDGRWLLGCQDGLFDWSPGEERRRLADPEADLPENRFNDGKTGPGGVVFIGTMAISGEKDGRGSLYKWDGRRATKVLGDITISNGLAWSGDGRTFWFIDTPTGRVDAFDYDDGELTTRRPVLDGFPGHPDGMCVTERDTLLVAQWDGGCVVHADPASGEEIRRIAIPTKNVTSCCFGGENLTTLFVTTAGGGVFAVDGLGLRGRPIVLAKASV